MTKEQKDRIIFIVSLIVFPLFVRFIGCFWGLPNENQWYSFHPDESLLLANSMNLNIPLGEWLPHYYNYSSLYLYLIHFVTLILQGLGLAGDTVPIYQSTKSIILTMRLINSVLAVVSTYYIYKALRLFFDHETSKYYNLLLYAPAFFMHSFFMTVDIPAAFFVSLCLWQTAKIIKTDNKARAALWASVFAGLAMGTKYNAGLVLIAPLSALFLTRSKLPNVYLYLVGSAIVCAVVFIITTPGILLDSNKFWADIAFERAHMSNPNFDLVFQQTAPGWLYHIYPNLVFGFGPIMLLIAMGGLIVGIRKNNELLPFVIFIALYYLLIGAAQAKFLRYTFPLYPALAITGAYFMDWLRPSWKPIAKAVFIGGVFINAVLTFSVWYDAVRLDTRTQAKNMIETIIPIGSKIGFVKKPWFYTPPFFPETNAYAMPDYRLQRMRENSRYIMNSAEPDWNPQFLADFTPDYIVISQFERMDEKRMNLPEYKAFMDKLRTSYSIQEEIGADYKTFYPHDMLYISPEIQIWKRR